MFDAVLLVGGLCVLLPPKSFFQKPTCELSFGGTSGACLSGSRSLHLQHFMESGLHFASHLGQVLKPVLPKRDAAFLVQVVFTNSLHEGHQSFPL
jgi:hypothetical protein